MAFLAPSILSADLLKLEQQIKTVEAHGADYIHIDVMDGHFVPNLTFGPVIVKSAKQCTHLPLDVHLMIEHPEHYVADFAKAGADIISVHAEATRHLDRLLNAIKELGPKAGVSINPATPVQHLIPILGLVDLVLVMSVNPGFGGQKFIPYALDKINQLRNIRAEREFQYLIEVDGGINPQTIVPAVRNGADILVAGNAVFGQKDIAAASKELKNLMQTAMDV